jgi:RNA polymerase-binding transcription factor DksA
MDADQARERLAQERERLSELRHEYDSLREESEDDALHELSHYDQHQADTGTETFERERDLSVLEQIEGELADVEHALRRLDEGTYGTCEACGKAIPDERLDALPATRFCLDDQALAEQESKAIAAPASEAE